MKRSVYMVSAVLGMALLLVGCAPSEEEQREKCLAIENEVGAMAPAMSQLEGKIVVEAAGQQQETSVTSSHWLLDEDNWASVNEVAGQQTIYLCREGESYRFSSLGLEEYDLDTGSLWAEQSVTELEYVGTENADGQQRITWRLPDEVLEEEWQQTIEGLPEEVVPTMDKTSSVEFVYCLDKEGNLTQLETRRQSGNERQAGEETVSATTTSTNIWTYAPVTAEEAQAKIDEIWQQISDPLTLYRQAVAMTEAWEAVRVESEITLTDAWEDQQTKTTTTSSKWYIDADNWVTVSQQDGQQTSLVCREGTAYLVTPAGSMETTADGSLWGEYSLEDMEFVRQDVNDSLQYVVMQVPADKLQADWESQPTVQQMTEGQRAGLPRPVARQYTFHLNKVGQLSERDETIDFEYEKQLEGGGTAAATQRQQTTSSYTVIASEDAQAKIDEIWQQATGG